jgi:hypothetical protein
MTTSIPMAKLSVRGVIKAFAIFAVCAVLAVASGRTSVVAISRVQSPSIALGLTPDDPGALVQQADLALAKSPTPETMDLASGLAQRSLIGLALNPRAVRILGYAASGGAPTAKANRLIELSARLGRRDFGAQIWLINSSVTTNNLERALAHYDVALRSNEEGGRLLFPLLLRALEEPQIRTAFLPYVKSGAPWIAPFFRYAIAQSGSQIALATTVAGAGGFMDMEVYGDLISPLLGRLVSNGSYAAARDLYLSFNRKNANVLTSISFDNLSRDHLFAPLTWQLIESSGRSAAWANENSPSGDTQHLQAYAASGERGLVARKVLFLAQGTYRLSESHSFGEASRDSATYWDMSCAHDRTSSSVWHGLLTSSPAALESFEVPADCPVQFWDLVIGGGQGQRGTSLTINSISLTRAKN